MTIQKPFMALLKKLDKGSTTLFNYSYYLKNRNYALYTLVLSATLCLGPSAVGQQAPSREIVPEEIIVTLPTSLSKLRREVYKAENKVYEAFNALNEDLEYDVKCEMENRQGTKMRVRVCKPNYYRFAMSEEAATIARQFSAYMESAPTAPGQMFHLPTPSISRSGGPGIAALPHKDKKMEQKIRTAIAVSPEFVEAVKEYAIVNEYYEEQRRARFED